MKPWKEVIEGIRNAVLGKEVREDLAQMGEYVEQFANTAGENIKKAIDPTLSVEGKAADAAKVGEAVGQLKDTHLRLTEIVQTPLYTASGDALETADGQPIEASVRVIRTAHTLDEAEYLPVSLGLLKQCLGG